MAFDTNNKFSYTYSYVVILTLTIILSGHY